MGWLKTLSDLHVQCATLFERVKNLAQTVDDLSKDQHETDVRVGRLEGVAVTTAMPEVMRQLADIQQRLTLIEGKLKREMPLDNDPLLLLPKPSKRDRLSSRAK